MTPVSSPSFTSLPFSRSLLNGHVGHLCSRPTRTFEARGERTLNRELEEADEILRSCHSLDPWLLLVIVRIAPLFLRSLQWKGRGHLYSQGLFLCSSLTCLLDPSLGGDFLAGLTVACILIPQSVSYGTSLARLSPTAGLVCHGFHFALHHLHLSLISHPMTFFLSAVFGIYSRNFLCHVRLLSSA